MTSYWATTDNLRKYLFSDVIADFCLTLMKTHCATPEEIAYGIRDIPSLNFIDPSRNRNKYAEIDHEAYYLCKYGMAYAFEYVMYYDILLQMFKGNEMRILSFGCGSNLDAWSAAYACTKRRQEHAAAPKIYYEGLDYLKWPFFIINPSGKENVRIRTRIPGNRINDEIIIPDFYVTDLVNADITDFAKHVRQSVCDVCDSSALIADVLMFPMILNELNDVEPFAKSLASLTFNNQMYYIIGAYSSAKCKNDAGKMNRIVDVFKERGYQAEYNLDVLLDGDAKDIKTSYSIEQVVTDDQGHPIYEVHGSIQSLDNGSFKFSYNSPLWKAKEYLDKLAYTAEYCNNPTIINARRASMMINAQFRFQIIRLMLTPKSDQI